MATPWEIIETTPEAAAALSWRRWLGPAFEAVAAVCLRETQRSVQRIACGCGCACNHRVCRRGTKLVGVCDCGEECEDVPLTAADVKVWELDLTRLGRAVAKALDCGTAVKPFGPPRTMQLAALGNPPLPILLTIQPDADQLTHCVAQLVARLPKGFILLTPTKLSDARVLELLAKVNVGCFDLETHVTLLPSGKLQARKSGGELFSPWLPTANQPTEENQARQVFALIEKLESGRRLKNPSVMEVFRLYCIIGKTTEQIEAACHCAKGTVINRLAVIREATGRDPVELRAFSPYLQRIEESITDSRAEHIHRKALVHGTEEQEDESE